MINSRQMGWRRAALALEIAVLGVAAIYLLATPISLHEKGSLCGTFATHMLDKKAPCYTTYSELRLLGVVTIGLLVSTVGGILAVRPGVLYSGAVVTAGLSLVAILGVSLGGILWYAVPIALVGIFGAVGLFRRARVR